jgi:hypothetical protein
MTSFDFSSARVDPAAGPPPEAARLRERVLAWLETMRVPGQVGAYRLNRGVAPTPFASCFAVFVRHLFGDLDTLSSAERAAWLASLQDLQDPATGLFVDSTNAARAPDPTHDAEHLNRQLTTFVLSAIDALGGQPRYPLRFLDDWKAPEVLRRWLSGLNWSNPWNSGNKAMFMGIFLLYDAEHTGDPRSRLAVEAWFDWHERHQNPKTGFWGVGPRADYIDGMGGAYHQFTLFHYANRPLRYPEQIIDRTLFLQQPDGMYSPHSGGATCYELDAADILIQLHRRHLYRTHDIQSALRRVLVGTLSNQNPDGGFCWGRPRPFGLAGYSRLAGSIFQHRSPVYWYLSWRSALAIQARPNPQLRTGWADQPRAWTESSIFDTWFRCLTIAEISHVLTDIPYAQMNWQYLSVPGLGWFDPRPPVPPS